MRTYMIEDIKVEIGAEIVRAFHEGREVIPKMKKNVMKIRAQRLWTECKKNKYLATHTKAFLTAKITEITLRSLGFYQLYLLARDKLMPHALTIWTTMDQFEITRFVFCVDVGFALGLFVAFIYRQCKKQISHWLFERSIGL